MMKEAREMKEKWSTMLKMKHKFKEKMIEQAKAAISWKNAKQNWKSSFNLSLSIAEKSIKDELSNKEAQTKLVEKMLGDAN
jgi:F-type H+-transporting ATPase subunit b